MQSEIYEELADALDKLPNRFPRTPSNVEIPMLMKIFSEEEAAMAVKLNGQMEPVDEIADRLNVPVKEIRSNLMKMVKRGLVWFDKEGGKPRFRLAPFVVGIYESFLEELDHEFSHLFENYMLDGGAAGIMKADPSLTRVIPAKGTAKAEWILPYDDVIDIMNQAESFKVQDCICRKQKDFIHRDCDFPLKNCLSFSNSRRGGSEGAISREEALKIIDDAEKLGLVHTVSNMREGVGYICNCCGCCCGILRTINEMGIENSVAYANYYAEVDEDDCTNCGECIERCQVYAIEEVNNSAFVIREKCIGCGLCVTGCDSDAVHLYLKPENEIVHPPKDYDEWESARMKNRS